MAHSSPDAESGMTDWDHLIGDLVITGGLDDVTLGRVDAAFEHVPNDPLGRRQALADSNIEQIVPAACRTRS